MTRHPLAQAVAAAAGLASVLAGCGNDSPEGGATGGSTTLGNLANATFLSTHVTQAGDDFPLAPNTHISLQFGASHLSARAGCNILGADASLRDNVIDVVGGLSATEMGCAQRLMRQDQWLADLLTNSPVATLDDDRLTLTSGDTVVEFVNEETAHPDRPLTGTEWTLETMGGSSPDSSASSVPAGVQSTLTIDESGQVSVRPGCNSGGGQATIGDDVIDFGPIALTKMACPDDEMDVENFVMTVLDGQVRYTVDADSLTLTKGGYMLIYRTR